MFNLNQRFRTVRVRAITAIEQEALTVLYLPIIGRDAFSIYMALYYQLPSSSPQIRHADLFDQLAIDQAKFKAAREKLEALGLLQTYQQDLQAGTQWVYKVFMPEVPQTFLAEPLLASLLAHYLGDGAYAEIVSRYTASNVEIAGENITKSFFEVIGTNSFEHITTSISENAYQEKAIINFHVKADQQIDLTLLTNLLQNNGVTKADLLKNTNELQLLKQLYALSDLELARNIQSTLQADAKININALQSKLANDFSQTQLPKKTDSVKKVPVKLEQKNNQPLTAEQSLLKAIKDLSPLQFLAKLRKQKNGFVTDAEQKTITKLVKEQYLPTEVLNVAIYQLAAREDRASLSQALLQAIVNDWRQVGITDAKAAFTYLNKRNTHKGADTQKSNRGRKGYTSRSAIVKETRPDWEKQTVAPVASNELSAAQSALAALNAKIKAEKEQNNG
ncbi:replication initiation and membrane attachment protein DnaB [Weissella oryzae SG25]|uniref:Replication initiation and membrane attachment protein DnaB n=1 Tax=Weissella oryzae (strain DSM 25784 / JCM 18191 / LMG 30913 / SG25) TaxID=1329250 RepID=A0A069CT17_WEIOS|nr:DnaD domain protein [Weissella oryzae]GAK30368.1 replication initiation and membrane attachment protein DnaB [Weissella oryzae SG25]